MTTHQAQSLATPKSQDPGVGILAELKKYPILREESLTRIAINRYLRSEVESGRSPELTTDEVRAAHEARTFEGALREKGLTSIDQRLSSLVELIGDVFQLRLSMGEHKQATLVSPPLELRLLLSESHIPESQAGRMLMAVRPLVELCARSGISTRIDLRAGGNVDLERLHELAVQHLPGHAVEHISVRRSHERETTLDALKKFGDQIELDRLMGRAVTAVVCTPARLTLLLNNERTEYFPILRVGGE